MSIKLQLRRLLHLLPAMEQLRKTRPQLCGVQVVNNWVGYSDGHRLARVEIPLHLWPASPDRPRRYQLPLTGLRAAARTDVAALAYLDPANAVDETMPDLSNPALSAQAVTGRALQWVTPIGLEAYLQRLIHARAMAHKQARDEWQRQHAEFVAKNRAAALAAKADWKAVPKPPKGDRAAAAAYKAAKVRWDGWRYDLSAAHRKALQKHRDSEPKLKYDVALTPAGAALSIVAPEGSKESAAMLYGPNAAPVRLAKSVNVDARYLRDAIIGMAGADSRVVITLSTEDVMMPLKVEPLNAATEAYALIMPMRA